MKRLLLAGDSLAESLRNAPEWTYHPERGSISRTYQFPAFTVAIQFVVAVAAAAEGMDHHLDVDIRYRKVRLEVTTHSAGGLTALDIELAQRADAVARKYSEGE